MLQVDRVTKRYGPLVGIEDASFTVRPGEDVVERTREMVAVMKV